MWGGLGATRWSWTRPVRREVQRILNKYPRVTANTYIGHPWLGWSRVSVDFWGPGGRGDPIGRKTSKKVLEDLRERPGPPYIRHTILEHVLWTSFGGSSYWSADDHSGKLRHVHVTYWR